MKYALRQPGARLIRWMRTLVFPTGPYAVAATFLMCATLACSLSYREWKVSRLQQHKEVMSHFQESVKLSQSVIQERISRIRTSLRTTQGTFGIVPSDTLIDRPDWSQFAQKVIASTNVEGIESLSIIQRIEAENLPDALKLACTDEAPNVAVSPSALMPAERSEYWLVTHSESTGELRETLGFDVATCETFRDALEKSRDSNLPIVTGRLNPGGDDGAATVAICLPIYASYSPQATIEQRRVAVRGWISVRLCLADLIKPSEQADASSWCFEVLEASPAIAGYSSQRPLWASHFGLQSVIEAERNLLSAQYQLHPSLSQTWIVHVAKAAPALITSNVVWKLLLAGLAVSFLAAAYVYVLDRRRRDARQLAEGMTAAFERRTEDLEATNRELAFQKVALDHAAIVSEADSNGRITAVNEAFCELSGYLPRELLGRNHRLLNSGQHPPAYWKDMYAALGRDEVWRGLFCNRAKDGSLYWVQTAVVALRDVNGAITRYVSIGMNVSDRVRADRKVAEAELYARGAIDSIQSHVAILDQAGTIIEVNLAWREFFRLNGGCGENALVGKDYIAMCYGENEQGSSAAEGIRDVLYGLIPEFSKIYDCHSPDEQRWFLLRATPFEGSGRARVVVAHTDITESHLIAEQLRQQTRELAAATETAQAATRAKSDFLATMSHEIRTPLNGVVGMIDLIAGTTLNTLQQRYVNLAKTSATSLLSVINDILDFSKIEAGKLELSPIDFDLGNSVEDVVAMLASGAHKKGLDISCCVGTGIARRVRGDSDRLRQILINLVSNAVKFSTHGSIAVRVVLEEQSEQSQLVRFTVSDTGIGIPKDKLDRLFKSFSQADASTTRRFGGTGLGLAISKRLAELMGGCIGVESEVGRGSTFWFTARFDAVCGEEPTYVPSLSNLRILLVGGSETQRELLGEQLAVWQARTTQTSNTTSGISILQQAIDAGDPFNIAIVDSAMTAPDPFEFAEIIASQKHLSGLSIVLQNPITSPFDLESVLAAGFSGILTTPIRQSQILDTIMNAVAVAGTVDRGAMVAQLPATLPTSSPAPQRTGRVLVAEDNEINQVVIREILNKAGYESQIVSNGIEAVQAVRTSSIAFDVVLMDCQMPELDGFDATRAIRKFEKTREGSPPATARGHLPIIALTANAMKGDKESCLAAGMNAYVSKPINPTVLLQTIDQAINEQLQELTARGTTMTAKSEVVSPPKCHIPAEPPLLPGELLDRCMGNVGIAKLLLEKFEKQVVNDLLEIERLLAAKDVAQLAKTVHALKGASGAVAATHLHELARKVEEFAREGSIDKVILEHEALRSEIQRCVGYLPIARNLVDSNSQSPGSEQ